MKLQVPILLCVIVPFSAFAEAEHNHASPYRGEEHREIKSLSADDVADLNEGKGWGFAKAAELNGVPGPSHVLEMKDALELTVEQKAIIVVVFKRMKADAVSESRSLIEGEARLEAAFRKGRIDSKTLELRVGAIEESRARLRFAHLSAHLALLDVLTKPQIDSYNRLRGYKESD